MGEPGGDRLSRVLRRSIMGAGAFHGRVRNGIGCGHPAEATRSAHRIWAGSWFFRRTLPVGHRPSAQESEDSPDPSWVGGTGLFRPAADNRPQPVGARREKRPMTLLRNGHGRMRAIKPIGRLVRLSFTRCRASTCLLSTWWSSTALIGNTRFQVGFPLRCLQRLSRPYIATLHCGWRHNRSTRGTSIPVLSY